MTIKNNINPSVAKLEVNNRRAGTVSNKSSFGSELNKAVKTVANVAGGVAGFIAPGASGVVSGAINMAANQSSGGGVAAMGANAGSLGGGGSVVAGGGMGGSGALGGLAGAHTGAPSTGSASMDQGLDGVDQNLQFSSAMNLRFLNIQMQMQQENRTYGAISNVMKMRHETANKMISNIRG